MYIILNQKTRNSSISGDLCSKATSTGTNTQLPQQPRKLVSYFELENIFPPRICTPFMFLISSNLEYCSWWDAPRTTLHQHDAIWKKTMKLIDNPAHPSKLLPPDHRRAFSGLSPFYLYFHGFYSQKLSSIFPPLQGVILVCTHSLSNSCNPKLSNFGAHLFPSIKAIGPFTQVFSLFPVFSVVSDFQLV